MSKFGGCTLSGKSGMWGPVAEFAVVSEAMLRVSSEDPVAGPYLVLDCADRGFCQALWRKIGWRVEWCENFAADGPHLSLARAYHPGSTQRHSTQWNAPTSASDALPFSAAAEILKAFFEGEPRPTRWLWIPVVAPKLESLPPTVATYLSPKSPAEPGIPPPEPAEGERGEPREDH